ncbi:MAG: glycosyltransferase [Flavobacteriales bacterium]|nr:glycosyltransferase [Flavobacteriales bacterium]MCB9168240.1 glycosyltransferase [Flavobacteriales bacterium]
MADHTKQVRNDALPLRLLVVIPGDPHSNAMPFSRRQARAMAESGGADVRVFFLEDRMSPLAIWRAGRRFRAVAREFRPDVVHAHYGTVTALFCVINSPAPVAITFHGSDLNPTPHDGFLRDLVGRIISQMAALFSSGIICVSTQLRDRLWWRRGGVRILPMGVELDRYVPLERNEARRRLGWQDRGHVVIFNATAPERKRVDIARAVEQVLQQRGMRMELELLLGGITQQQMPVLLSAADALLLCSNSEGSPTMVKEAMACDLPVVTSDVGDVRDRLKDVRPGAIVAQEVTALADALEAVLRLGERSNGRALAVRNQADAASLDRDTLVFLRSLARP